MRTLAMIHTGSVVIEPINRLARQQLGDVRIINYLDDRIVADLEESRATPESVRRRISLIAEAAVESRADAILITCSSISHLADDLERTLSVPVLKIDEAMADVAVGTGERIGVVATLPTTLEPTCTLIRERAAVAAREVTIQSVLVREAFELIARGDGTGHDTVVREAVQRLMPHVDVVVLAQASMSRAVDGLATPVPVLTSPALGVARVREKLEQLPAPGTQGTPAPRSPATAR